MAAVRFALSLYGRRCTVTFTSTDSGPSTAICSFRAASSIAASVW